MFAQLKLTVLASLALLAVGATAQTNPNPADITPNSGNVASIYNSQCYVSGAWDFDCLAARADVGGCFVAGWGHGVRGVTSPSL